MSTEVEEVREAAQTAGANTRAVQQKSASLPINLHSVVREIMVGLIVLITLCESITRDRHWIERFFSSSHKYT